MAKHHQLNICYKQAAHEGGRSCNYLYEGDTIRAGVEVTFAALYPQLHIKLESLVRGHVEMVCQTSQAIISGLDYVTGCAVVTGYDDDDDSPSFAIERSIIVHEQTKYFVIERTVVE